MSRVCLGRQAWAPRAWARLLLALAGVTGCSKEPAMQAWIDEDTAYLRCETVSVGASSPFDQMPRLGPTAGMFAGDMDAMSLENLGFDRDSLVCLSLQAPSDSTLAEADSSLTRLSRVRQEVLELVSDPDACMCEALYLRGLRAFASPCSQRTLDNSCLVRAQEQGTHGSLLGRLTRQVEHAVVPTYHWRMVGYASSKTPLRKRYPQLLAAFKGGTEVFLRHQPIPASANRKLIEALLGQPKVVAVFRQASGQGLMVARQDARDVLVLDAFWYPKSLDPNTGIYGHIDNAAVDRVVQALKAPVLAKSWPGLKNLQAGFGWRLPPLLRIEEGRRLATKLDAVPYDEKRERWAHPQPYAEQGWVHWDAKAPRTLHMSLGQIERRLPLALDGLADKDAPRWPSFVAADGRDDYLLRGSILGSAWIYGSSILPLAAGRMAAKGVGDWSALPHGFRYRWGPRKLAASTLRTTPMDAFFRMVAARGGEISWQEDPAEPKATVTLKLDATN